MSIVINTKQGSNASGAGIIVAKSTGGVQKTTRIDPAKSVEANVGAAVGALLNRCTTDRQQAMLRHPSGGQRVRVESTSDAGGKFRYTINV